MQLFWHQAHTAEFILQNPRCYIQSDPGTGKTISVLEAFHRARQTDNKTGRLLVVAPLSILKPSWADDVSKWLGDAYSVSIAYAKNRQEAFRSSSDILITNHDAVKWMISKPEIMREAFPEGWTHWLAIDEATAFKNPTSQRSKAMLTVRTFFDVRIAMSGTPTAKDVLDIFHPTLIVDDGVHLGNKFFAFRNQVADPLQVGPNPNMVKWVPRDNAEEFVAQAMSDMTIRYKFEDCIDIPPNQIINYKVDLPPKLRNLYDQMLETSVIEAESGDYVTAVNAAVRVRKLLQLLTGAVYDQDGETQVFHTDRYELVMQLVQEREHSLVAFNWKHEVKALTALADKLGITYGVIDGSVSSNDRTQVVNDFQAGKLQVVFAHPQSAGHGLTLTRATATIWASPTYNAEHYQQFCRRIYRAGQKQATQTIHIAARDTAEEEVYENLQGKLTRMDDLLALFQCSTTA